MNVYVRALASALARAGVECDVFTRSEDPSEPAVVEVEPGFRVVHVVAGPQAPVPQGARLPRVPGQACSPKERRPRSDAATDGGRLGRVIRDGGPDQTQDRG